MKNSLFILIILAVVSCGKKQAPDSTIPQQETPAQSENEITNKAENKNTFDINTIPISSADIGSFPYLSAPEGYKYSKEVNKRYEEKYFFYNDSLAMPVGGKYYHAMIYPEEGEEFSDTYIVKNYEQAITKLGGVEIYSGGFINKAHDLFRENKPSYAKDMYDPYPYKYKQFVLRTSDGNIWFELCHGLNVNGIDYTVMFEGEIKETIRIVKADELKESIEKTGKAILYINFDTDKATLKPDGIQAVAEIAKLMQNDASLRLSIEGHTDSTGSADHNKILSLNRAETVEAKLKESGIESDRLKTSGHGADQPLVANDSEEGKAKNRRVEIVKF